MAQQHQQQKPVPFTPLIDNKRHWRIFHIDLVLFVFIIVITTIISTILSSSYEIPRVEVNMTSERIETQKFTVTIVQSYWFVKMCLTHQKKRMKNISVEFSQIQIQWLRTRAHRHAHTHMHGGRSSNDKG